MAEIRLTNGSSALIDDDDYERLNGLTWGISRTGGYPQTALNGKKTVRMHRFILNAPDGFHVDHVNGDPLDNRKINLRLCNRSENQGNRAPNRKHGRLYKGVYPFRGKWRAHIAGKHIGVFAAAEVAARAYDAEATKKWGQFARLNFPIPSLDSPDRDEQPQARS